LEAGKLIDQSPSVKLRLYQTLANTEKTLPYFPFPEEVLPRKRKTKQKNKKTKKRKK
jgi:hypothetical protein